MYSIIYTFWRVWAGKWCPTQESGFLFPWYPAAIGSSGTDEDYLLSFRKVANYVYLKKGRYFYPPQKTKRIDLLFLKSTGKKKKKC